MTSDLIGKEREDLEIINKTESLCFSTLYFKREYGTTSIREVFIVQFVVRMGRERRMVDLVDLRVLREPFYDLQGV